MKYELSNKDILFVGLNPTEQAKKHNAVFCQTPEFWKLLSAAGYFDKVTFDKLWKKAEIDKKINKGVKNDGRYKEFAPVCFGTETRIGYCDLIPDCFEKKSNKVEVMSMDVMRLLEKLSPSNIKKIGLLGKQVAKKFMKHASHNERSVKGAVSYGYLDTIEINGNMIEVYCLPFPTTTPMKTEDKIKEYKKMNAGSI
jgi:G:T/U-mismatch repair DNA glycosylase